MRLIITPNFFDHLKLYFIFFLLFAGSCFKLIPVAAWDELALLLLIFFYLKLNNKKEKFFFLYFLFFYILIIHSIYGFLLYNNIQNLRFFVIFLLVFFFFRSNFFLIINKFKKYIHLNAFLLLLINCLLGTYNSFRPIIDTGDSKYIFIEYFLWTGTAYTSYILFLALVFILCYNKNILLSLVALAMFLYGGYILDSRAVYLFFNFSFFIFFVIHWKKSYLLQTLFILFFSIIIIFIFFDSALYNSYLRSYTKSLFEIYNSLVSRHYVQGVSDERTVDLTNFIDHIYYNLSLSSFFGNGLNAHRYELPVIFPNLYQGSIARPIGFIAQVYDFGFLYFFFLVMIFGNIIRIICIDKNYLRIKLILLAILTPTVLIIFATNQLDIVLWFMFGININFYLFLRSMLKNI
jgi:hypothetical protein